MNRKNFTEESDGDTMIIPLLSGRMPLDRLAALLGIPCPPSLIGAVPERLVTRSTEIRPGDLFCALCGKEDGHAYLADAAARGAVAALTEKDTDAALPCLKTPSVTAALSGWSRRVLAFSPCLRIGITGSVGKTTTKNVLQTVLSLSYRVHATPGNFNNHLGVPFTVLSMPEDAEVLITEMGTNHPGEIEALSTIVRPQISLITCVGHAHIGAFGTRAAIAAEKAAVVSHAPASGCVFFPVGEPLLENAFPVGIRRFPVSPLSFLPGTEEEITDIALGWALGYAEAVARFCGMPEDGLRKGLLSASADPAHRQTYRAGGITFVDDGYNASPESMLAALRFLVGQATGRKIACLGSMRELGDRAPAMHRAVGNMFGKEADLLFFYGAYADAYLAGARAGGCAVCHALPDASAEDTAKAVFPYLHPGDTVLCKASRAERADAVCSALCRMAAKENGVTE